MLNSVSSAKEYYFSAAKNEIHGPILQNIRITSFRAADV